MYRIYYLTLVLIITFTSCSAMKNFKRPNPTKEAGGFFYKVEDGTAIYIFQYCTIKNPAKTIYILSGITGINHHNELDVIKALGADSYRVVVIHPRGTGYSEGKRGDMKDFSLFQRDYFEIIKDDLKKQGSEHRGILFGHSMSTALAISLAVKLHSIAGV